tara:strand:- start:3952 stop:4173 length:222 start_codon:yes stop_codon:yes gene_type:complete
MIKLEPVVTYLKGHRLNRMRMYDENGVSLWRAIKIIKNKVTAVIKQDKLDKDYTTTSKFIIYDGIHDYGYLEK